VEDDYERAVSDIAATDSIAELDAVRTAVRVRFAGDPRRVRLERLLDRRRRELTRE
jgi:hypothetical protein